MGARSLHPGFPRLTLCDRRLVGFLDFTNEETTVLVTALDYYIENIDNVPVNSGQITASTEDLIDVVTISKKNTAIQLRHKLQGTPNHPPT